MCEMAVKRISFFLEIFMLCEVYKQLAIKLTNAGTFSHERLWYRGATDGIILSLFYKLSDAQW